MFIKALNQNLNLQRFKVLYVSGNHSGILSKLDRKFTDLEVRRAFTTFQLMTILEEIQHSLVIVEHDPLLYEDAAEMVEYVSHALSDTAKEAAMLLYSPWSDPFLEELTKNADRTWCSTKVRGMHKGISQGRTRRLRRIRLLWRRSYEAARNER
jgi:hypothetical protein